MKPHVCILLGTFNGGQYLRQQLESFVAQTGVNWSLRVSDDGSDDDSRDIIASFIKAHPDRDIRLYEGPKQGSAANFLSLLGQSDLPARAWIALSDQDDVWLPNRLEHAVQVMMAQMKTGGGQGCVYASRTILTNADLALRGPSCRHPKAPDFGNALVQNVLAGNTMVLDPAAAALLQATAPAAMRAGVPHHDWWIYLLLSGAGAVMINDDRPGLYYRQHKKNHLGANRGLGKAWSRFAMIWDRRYADWIGRNLAALTEMSDLLTPENRARATLFSAWLSRRHSCPGSGAGFGGPETKGPKLGDLGQIGVWRQSRAGNLMLHLAAAAGRL